jgi:hypothetical protein
MPALLPRHAPADLPDPRHAHFLTLLPAVRSAARTRFRYVSCPDRRDDLVLEAVALAWAWHARLVARGRDPAAFAATFARLAARAVAGGRRLAGQEPARDVLSRACRRRHGFAVEPLPVVAPSGSSPLAEALSDNTRSPVPVQAQFRVDFPTWLDRLAARDRRIVVRLAVGHRTSEVAAAVGLSAARVSQLRGEFRRSYLSFLAGPRAE